MKIPEKPGGKLYWNPTNNKGVKKNSKKNEISSRKASSSNRGRLLFHEIGPEEKSGV